MDSSWNSTSPEYGVGIQYPQPVRIVLLALGLIYIVIGVPGNLLIIFAVLKVKSLRIGLNMFIVNLALADFIQIGLLLPLNLADLIIGRHLGGRILCFFTTIVRQNIYCVSLTALSFIALSRYIKVCQSQTYPNIFSKINTAVACVTPWVVGPMLSTYYIHDSSSLMYDRTLHTCVDTKRWTPLSVAAMFVVLFTAITTPCCYWKLWQHSKQSEVVLRSHRNDVFSRLRYDVNRSSIKSNFIVFLMFIILYFPFVILRIFSSEVPASIHGIAMSVALGNSSLNCIVYGAMNTRIRQSYRHVLPAVFRVRVQPAEKSNRDSTLNRRDLASSTRLFVLNTTHQTSNTINLTSNSKRSTSNTSNSACKT